MDRKMISWWRCRQHGDGYWAGPDEDLADLILFHARIFHGGEAAAGKYGVLRVFRGEERSHGQNCTVSQG